MLFPLTRPQEGREVGEGGFEVSRRVVPNVIDLGEEGGWVGGWGGSSPPTRVVSNIVHLDKTVDGWDKKRREMHLACLPINPSTHPSPPQKKNIRTYRLPGRLQGPHRRAQAIGGDAKILDKIANVAPILPAVVRLGGAVWWVGWVEVGGWVGWMGGWVGGWVGGRTGPNALRFPWSCLRTPLFFFWLLGCFCCCRWWYGGVGGRRRRRRKGGSVRRVVGGWVDGLLLGEPSPTAPAQPRFRHGPFFDVKVQGGARPNHHASSSSSSTAPWWAQRQACFRRGGGFQPRH